MHVVKLIWSIINKATDFTSKFYCLYIYILLEKCYNIIVVLIIYTRGHYEAG